MRLLLTIIAFFGVTSVCAIPVVLKGEWVAPGSGYLMLTDSVAHLENRMWGTSFDFVNHKGNTLILQHSYDRARKEEIAFRILILTDSTLVMVPKRKSYKYIFCGADTIVFKKREYLYDSRLQLKKIIFNSLSASWSLQDYTIEIDSAGKLLYHYEGDSLRNKPKGFFEGTLNEQQRNKLLEILRSCNLKDLQFNPLMCCDGSISTFIIYFNNEKKVLRSMWPSRLTWQLESFFDELPGIIELTRSHKELNFEKHTD